MPDYRVNLESYNGPIDLLLYLIRREEVDIYDIPIARITEQYVQYVEVLHQLDPNLAGDFLVMAATLIEIKTRMLLPTAPAEEGGEGGLEIDPRAELVRQLLEYKAFKDAAGDLRDAADAQARRFPRRPVLPHGDQDEELDLEDVQVWDLLDAFSKLMSSIGATAPTHQVIYDDTPIELHQADILDRLQREGPMTFRRIFEGRTERVQLLGLFLAVLELVRLKLILAMQDTHFAEIHVHLNPNPPDEMAGALQETAAKPAAGAAGATTAVAAGALTAGQDGHYVADHAGPGKRGDRHAKHTSEEDGTMKPTDDDLDDKGLGDDDLDEELGDDDLVEDKEEGDEAVELDAEEGEDEEAEDLDEKDEGKEEEEEDKEEDDDLVEGDEEWDEEDLDEDEDEDEEEEDEEDEEDEEEDKEEEEEEEEDEEEDKETDEDEGESKPRRGPGRPPKAGG